mmetsp:Transcript_28815/g.52481  ORF Transcript_28815/g.52481 Transcript_28815/m.52481 type:complete len:194 (+) Transcript_28815:43-624(+)
MSAQDWQADVNSGTLSWFGTPTYAAAPPQPTPVPEDASAQQEAPIKPDLVEPSEPVAEEEEEDEVDLQDVVAAIDSELKADVTQLRALLIDNGAFHDACQQAVQSTASTSLPVSSITLNDSAALQKALNYISNQCQIELVDEEEAADMFDGPMDASVFYQLAKEYFSALCRTLSMTLEGGDGDDDGGHLLDTH